MLMLALIAASPQPQASLDFLEPLMGHCWVTTLGETVDRHCFHSMYAGAHVRDDHVVTSDGREVYAGSTVYSVEGDIVTFTYFNSMGGVGRGTAVASGKEVRFKLTMRASPDTPPANHEARWTIGDSDYVVTGAEISQRFTLDDR